MKANSKSAVLDQKHAELVRKASTTAAKKLDENRYGIPPNTELASVSRTWLTTHAGSGQDRARFLHGVEQDVYERLEQRGQSRLLGPTVQWVKTENNSVRLVANAAWN